MSRPPAKLLLIAATVTVGAFVPWYLSQQRSPQHGGRADRVPAVAKKEYAAPSDSPTAAKPVAMADAGTYAAVRYKEIKADPAAWAEVWKWRQEFSVADTPELQREVLGLAKQFGPEAILAILAAALGSEDEVLRLDAARSIALLPENRLRDGFGIGVGAADAETRGEVMDLVLQMQNHLRPELLQVALAAASADVQERAIAIIGEHPSPDFFTSLIEGLRTSNAEVRPMINEAIRELVAENFDNYDHAVAWWSKNRPRFDDLLTPIE